MNWAQLEVGRSTVDGGAVRLDGQATAGVEDNLQESSVLESHRPRGGAGLNLKEKKKKIRAVAHRFDPFGDVFHGQRRCAREHLPATEMDM